jgi:hypothetical protein
MEKIRWANRLKNEVLHRVKEERNIVHTITRRKDNWIGHILRRNCLLKHIVERKIEGNVEVTGKRRRRCRQLLDDLKEKRGYWKLKEELLDCTLWRSRFGRGYGPVVRQTTEQMRVSGKTTFTHFIFSFQTFKALTQNVLLSINVISSLHFIFMCF